jgi:hypothetical protein
MAPKLPWTPWHGVVKLREDVRTGTLSLADFAADLHDVMMQKGARPIYEDPNICADLSNIFATGIGEGRYPAARGRKHQSDPSA